MGEVLRGIGTIQIWQTIIFGTIVGICLMCGASFTFSREEVARIKSSATVVTRSCGSDYFTKKVRKRDCTLDVKFATKDGNIVETKVATTLNGSDTIGDTMPILYSESKPSDTILEKDKPLSPKIAASVLSCIGCIFVLTSAFNYHYRNSENWKTYQGASSIISSIRSE